MALYHPREDSHLLAAVLSHYVRNKRVLDMCSGTGILAEAALNAGAASALAVDNDTESLALLQKKKMPLLNSDLFDNVTGTFDVILCNPPYLPYNAREPKESAKATTGGKHGDEFILRFLKQVPKHLAPHGVVLLLLSSLTSPERIEKLLKKKGMKHRVIAQKKLFFETLEVWEIAVYHTTLSTKSK